MRTCMQYKPAGRLENEHYRVREYLDCEEVEQLKNACRKFNLHAERNHFIVVFLFKHGLRRQELLNLKWRDVNFKTKTILIKRVKNGDSGVHPLTDEQAEFLIKMRDKKRIVSSEYIFVNSQGNKMTGDAIHKIIAKAGKLSELDIKMHPHMLRHACGNYLTNEEEHDPRKVMAYLGHTDYKSTMAYTKVSPKKFLPFLNGFNTKFIKEDVSE